MTIITDIDFFDTVYLKNDPEQLARTFIDLEVGPAENNNHVLIFHLACGCDVSRHYRREFSKEKDEVKIALA